jgi:hypothetical protein
MVSSGPACYRGAMARPSRGPFAKRQKELARKEKQKDKQARRTEAKELAANSSAAAEGDDPDLAGIQLGPQPRQDLDDLPGAQRARDDDPPAES